MQRPSSVGPTAARAASGHMLNEYGSMSTNTGTAPRRVTAEAVETNEIAGTITSSPGPIPAHASIISSVTVPFTAEMPKLCALILRETHLQRMRPSGLNPPHCGLLQHALQQLHITRIRNRPTGKFNHTF